MMDVLEMVSVTHQPNATKILKFLWFLFSFTSGACLRLYHSLHYLFLVRLKETICSNHTVCLALVCNLSCCQHLLSYSSHISNQEDFHAGGGKWQEFKYALNSPLYVHHPSTSDRHSMGCFFYFFILFISFLLHINLWCLGLLLSFITVTQPPSSHSLL